MKFIKSMIVVFYLCACFNVQASGDDINKAEVASLDDITLEIRTSLLKMRQIDNDPSWSLYKTAMFPFHFCVGAYIALENCISQGNFELVRRFQNLKTRLSADKKNIAIIENGETVMKDDTTDKTF